MAVGDLGEGARLAALTGAWVCFEDEAGQALRPGRACSWAPRGRTPVVRVSGNSGRLSVAGMACVKPGRPGRFFYPGPCPPQAQGRPPEHLRSRLRAPDHRRARCPGAPVIVIWDNLSTHRSRKMRAYTEAREDWLTMIQLPAYAPDLNAVEGAWSVMKSGLGNHAAATLDQLEAMILGRLRTIQRRPDLINALLGQTGLTLDPQPP